MNIFNGIEINSGNQIHLNEGGGITPEGTIEINKNDTYDVTQYASASVNVAQPKPCTFEFYSADAAGSDCNIRYIAIVDGVADLVDGVVSVPFTLNNVMAGSVLWLETYVGLEDHNLIFDTEGEVDVIENKMGGNGNVHLTISVNGDCTVSQSEAEWSRLEITEDGTYLVNDYNSVNVNVASGLIAYYNGETTDLVLPKGVTSIPAYAFYNGSLTSIAGLDGVKIINKQAFRYCGNLTDVILPAINSMGANAFGNCTNLQSVTFGRKPAYLDVNAFGGCTDITFNCPWSEKDPINYSGETFIGGWGASSYTINFTDNTVEV